MSSPETLAEIRAKKAAYMREWYARNREKVRQWKVRYGIRRPAATAERSRRYRNEHAREIAERKRRYDAEHRAEIAERKRLHRLANPELYRDRWRRWSGMNPDKRAASVHAWRAANPDAAAEWARRRRARKKGARKVALTRREWKTIKALFGNACAYCGAQPARLEQDHVIPLARGGQHTTDNIVPACMTCNRRKHTSLDWKPLMTETRAALV